MAKDMLAASRSVAAVRAILVMLFFMELPPEMDFPGFLTGAGSLVNTGSVIHSAFLVPSWRCNVINEGIFYLRQESNYEPEKTRNHLQVCLQLRL
jgi:hypothetical protein